VPEPRRRLSNILGLSLIIGTAVLAVVAYNSWRVCCGQCTLRDLTVIPWITWLLVVVNAAALLALHLLRLRSARLAHMNGCATCHARLSPRWRYCQACGTKVDQRQP